MLWCSEKITYHGGIIFPHKVKSERIIRVKISGLSDQMVNCVGSRQVNAMTATSVWCIGQVSNNTNIGLGLCVVLMCNWWWEVGLMEDEKLD